MATPSSPPSPLVPPAPGAAPSAEFLADLEEQSRRLEHAEPEEIIRFAVQRYFPKLTMATAFGPEGCVILYYLGKIEPRTHVFNLDTGYQFQETLDLRDRIAQKYGIEVEMKRPETTVEQYEALHGGPLYKTNPEKCCFDRNGQIQFAGTTQLGIYTLEQPRQPPRKFAVNLLDSRESNVAPRQRPASVDGAPLAEKKGGIEGRRETWKWWLAAGLAVMLGEWYIYNRRVYL